MTNPNKIQKTMETNLSTSTIVKSYTVPMDVFMDILKIFLVTEIHYHIEGINERENSLLIQVRTEANNISHKKLRHNIAFILTEYGFYLQGKPGEFNEPDQE